MVGLSQKALQIVNSVFLMGNTVVWEGADDGIGGLIWFEHFMTEDAIDSLRRLRRHYAFVSAFSEDGIGDRTVIWEGAMAHIIFFADFFTLYFHLHSAKFRWFLIWDSATVKNNKN